MNTFILKGVLKNEIERLKQLAETNEIKIEIETLVWVLRVIDQVDKKN